jgi:hypothetical protein
MSHSRDRMPAPPAEANIEHKRHAREDKIRRGMLGATDVVNREIGRRSKERDGERNLNETIHRASL